MHLFVGMFLGLFFQKCGDDASKVITNLGFLLCGVVYIAYTALMPAVLKCKQFRMCSFSQINQLEFAVPSEVSILKKERFNNWYQLRTYYIATMMFDIPLQVTFYYVP